MRFFAFTKCVYPLPRDIESSRYLCCRTNYIRYSFLYTCAKCEWRTVHHAPAIIRCFIFLW